MQIRLSLNFWRGGSYQRTNSGG